ncbi:glycosyl hydrolase family 28-related protein [Streptomyces sp. NPDC013740]|uniref:glycosyl hydrolase family 28-related protein n=1 Tax=Streptomyces sp. NPDC013740 TaxID=3364867 RepID=UPI0036FC2718
MSTSRRNVLWSALGAGGLAAGTGLVGAGSAQAAVAEAQAAGAAAFGAGWLNVRDYGAKGDDSADDQPAIQAAIDAAGQGGTVYLPPGKYRIASPITLRYGVTLRGDWAPHFPDRTNMVDSYIRPGIGNFTGTALITVVPAPDTSTDNYHDTAYRGGPRLYGLALNGRQQRDTQNRPVDGVSIAPGTRDVGMDKVTVWHCTGNGVNAQNAAALQFSQVGCTDNDGHGFTFGDASGTGGGLVDADLYQCYSQGNGLTGFDILNPNAVTMIDCRAEWNAGHGYQITGICYSMVLVGCNTDRSGQDGFHLSTAPGGRFLHLVGCLAKRDGRSGAGYAGFSVTGQAAMGVILTGCSASTGRDDANNENVPYSPSYGITTSALNSASFVAVSGGEFLGAVQPFNDAGKVLVRHSGVAAGTHTATGIVWDRSDVHTLSGAAGERREVEFWTRGGNRRWGLRAGAQPETGGGAGSAFELVRYGDGGAPVDVPISVNRQNGRITLGQAKEQGGSPTNVVVNAESSPGVQLNQATPGAQGYGVTVADAASRAFQVSVAGDAVNRLVIDANGTQSFGPGGTAARDVTWGRLGSGRVGSPDADLVVGQAAGRGLRVREGADATMGLLTLNGDTPVPVATTAVRADSRILLTVQEPGGTPSGVAFVAARKPGESFSVAGRAGDTSKVAWLLVNPA